MIRIFLGVVLIVFLSACTQGRAAYAPGPGLSHEVEKSMRQYGAATVGLGVIRDGQLVWTQYFGEQSAGIKAGPQTLFNVASVNKAVTAEVALILASKGLIDLDEPVSDYFVHPDLIDDPRHRLLTPRILLTHQAGFLNWPYEYEDGKLGFIDEPGNGNYHYAGIGFRIFAQFLEAKLGSSFPQIVRNHVFDPLGMAYSTNSHDKARSFDSVVVPVNQEGLFLETHDFDAGYWSAADDLFVTIPDYARFLIATMNNELVDPDFAALRAQVQTPIEDSDVWGCMDGGVDPCPSPYGHGIGWFVFGFEDGVVVHHGGNDQSEAAIGYYRPDTKNGALIFVNGAQGVLMWPGFVDLIDPDEQFQNVFHDVIARFFADKDSP